MEELNSKLLFLNPGPPGPEKSFGMTRELESGDAPRSGREPPLKFDGPRSTIPYLPS